MDTAAHPATPVAPGAAGNADGRIGTLAWGGYQAPMIVLRHGQSLFNLHFSATRRDPGIHDPPLTPEGLAQAEAAAAALADAGIRQIVASPYTRALQTAAPIAAALGVGVRISTLVRERFHFACDVGTARSTLQACWPAHDFSDIEEIWWPGSTESSESVQDRATRFRQAILAEGGAAETLVVSHWAFLLTLTGHDLQNGSFRRVDAAAPVAGWPAA